MATKKTKKTVKKAKKAGSKEQEALREKWRLAAAKERERIKNEPAYRKAYLARPSVAKALAAAERQAERKAAAKARQAERQAAREAKAAARAEAKAAKAAK